VPANVTPPVPPAVAIAVVSWNTRDLLAACLDSMRADADAGLAEVWVVDNGSSDGSQEMVRERYGWVRLLEAERNLGYGPAVNRVARETATPWVVAANADLELEPGALSALLAAGDADRGAGVIGPRLILPDGSTQPGVQPYPRALDALLIHLSIHRLSRRLGERAYLSGYWQPDRPAVVDWVTGAFLLIRREVFDVLGGFDEEQWMYAEDLDLCWRARQAGWRVRYEPGARVRHMLSVAAEKAFGDDEARSRRMLREDYAWMVRRRGRRSALANGAAQVAGLTARWAALSLARRPGKAAHVAAVRRRHVAVLRSLFQ